MSPTRCTAPLDVSLRELDELSPLAFAGEEHRRMCFVRAVLLSELREHALLFSICQQCVSDHDYREEHNGKDGRPMHHALADQSDEEAGILRMPDQSVQSISREPVLLAGRAQPTPPPS